MEKTGHIEIKVSGKKGNIEISPDNYDIKDLIELLQHAEALLFAEKKGRPVITHTIEKGSVKHILTTSMQAVIGFNAVLAQIQSYKSIDFLEYPTAKAFEYFQETARKQGVEFDIITSVPNTAKVTIDIHSRFERSEEVWVEAEMYFYGMITNIGGKSNPNLHLDTKEYGLLTISAEKDVLAGLEKNPVFKNYGVRAFGKQNIKTGEFDKSSFRFIDIINYAPSNDDAYLNSLIKKASKSWAEVPDTDAWLKDLRGYGV